MRLPRHPLRRRRSATAAAELAVFMPVLAVLILGCIDFGRFAYSHIALTNAARSGAFYGVMTPFTSTSNWLITMQKQAQEEMYGQTGYDPTNNPVTINQTALTKGTDSNGNTTWSNPDVVITIEDKYPTPVTGERRVKVTAHLTFNTLIVYPGLPSTVNMKRAVEMRGIR